MNWRGRSQRVEYLPTGSIRTNPQQPRRVQDAAALAELARSVAEVGVLQPISVRRISGGYELIAGERRLRAARMAGLHEVPCIVRTASEAETGLYALIENLQQRDLDYLDAAEALARLCARYSMSQTEAARRLGMSQSTIANKLRLLHHPPQVRQALRESGLSERHARTLLLAPEEARLGLIARASAEDWSVARLEQELLPFSRSAPRLATVCDLHLAVHAVERTVESARQHGISADCGREETPTAIIFTITLAKTQNP